MQSQATLSHRVSQTILPAASEPDRALSTRKPILVRMKTMLAAIIAKSALLSALAQTPTAAPSLKVVSLAPPAYPMTALAARVSGEVDLRITLLENGTLADVQVVSGPPMLSQAAIASAKASTFQFDRSESSYKLAYKFALESSDCNTKPYSIDPTFQYSSNTVTVTGTAPTICDPAITHVRALKCLYLWRCSAR